jgi:hypothetical protein
MVYARVRDGARETTLSRRLEVVAAPAVPSNPTSPSGSGRTEAPAAPAVDPVVAKQAVVNFVKWLQDSPKRVLDLSAESSEHHRASRALMADPKDDIRVRLQGELRISSEQGANVVSFALRLARKRGVFRRGEEIVQAEVRARLVQEGGEWRVENAVVTSPFARM